MIQKRSFHSVNDRSIGSEKSERSIGSEKNDFEIVLIRSRSFPIIPDRSQSFAERKCRKIDLSKSGSGMNEEWMKSDRRPNEDWKICPLTRSHHCNSYKFYTLSNHQQYILISSNITKKIMYINKMKKCMLYIKCYSNRSLLLKDSRL